MGRVVDSAYLVPPELFQQAQLSGTFSFFHSKFWVYVRVGGDGMDWSIFCPLDKLLTLGCEYYDAGLDDVLEV